MPTLSTKKTKAADAPAPPQGPLPITQDAPRRRRRPAVVGLGLALTVVGALGNVYWFDSESDRVSVIAVARDVAAGDVIQASDLASAEMAPDAALSPVPVSRQSDIVGKTAVADLSKGALVTDRSVRVGSDVARGKDTVGIQAKPGQLPARPLHANEKVLLVHASPEGDAEGRKGQSSTPDTIDAVVSRVGAPDANGARVVDVAVAGTDSPTVATWSASGSVTLVLKADD
ncbi:SAF domain-containing protein [Streptomyces sp. MZ04]|uniref:SAF domain-containing protein n=1 Tax=Streptomyces sp. MZ04 TaxID=2559236 RepID=UPI00107EBC69|nr:SAF domain-containing protein [Streptomyces sp. MZ04]TGB15512.1 hypothetical protein E2651_02515 [Streptomyces sp. MZ04]